MGLKQEVVIHLVIYNNISNSSSIYKEVCVCVCVCVCKLFGSVVCWGGGESTGCGCSSSIAIIFGWVGR